MTRPIPGKSSWPELVGKQVKVAATAIADERPDVTVEVIPLGTVGIPVVNPKRVRVFIDDHGLVSAIPRIG